MGRSIIQKWLVFGMIFVLVFSEFVIITSTEVSAAGGSGTEADPFQISNVTELQNMSASLGAHYILVNDIDASGTFMWNSGAGFKPIGDEYNYFTGSLDGQGYTITGLYFDRSSDNYVGLFGYIDSPGSVSNVSLNKSTVYGDTYVGPLVGQNYYGTITNCVSSGTTTGSYEVGGLIGRNSYGTVTNCVSFGTITGGSYNGGLIGVNSGGTVINCTSNSATWGDNKYTGGLIGYDNGGTVKNCTSTGATTGEGTPLIYFTGRMQAKRLSFCLIATSRFPYSLTIGVVSGPLMAM